MCMRPQPPCAATGPHAAAATGSRVGTAAMEVHARVAQLAERVPCKDGVVSSNLTLGSSIIMSRLTFGEVTRFSPWAEGFDPLTGHQYQRVIGAIGSAAVSKTAGCRFDSYMARHTSVSAGLAYWLGSSLPSCRSRFDSGGPLHLTASLCTVVLMQTETRRGRKAGIPLGS